MTQVVVPANRRSRPDVIDALYASLDTMPGDAVTTAQRDVNAAVRAAHSLVG